MATVTLDKLCKRYEQLDDLAVDHVEPRRRARRVHGPARALGLRQVDDAAHDRRPGGDLFGRAWRSTAASSTRCRRGPRHRDGVPVVRALSAHDGARQPRLRPAPARHRQGARSRAGCSDVAATLGLAVLLERKPYALSGGQRQRVALGRAIVRDPKVFLFDEPLSNLDASLRVSTRGELIKLHRRLGATMIYVTHDQVEAMTMGSRICIMDKGKVVQIGAPLEVYRRPAEPFVASFLGNPPMNLMPAPVEGGRLVLGAARLALPPALLADGGDGAPAWCSACGRRTWRVGEPGEDAHRRRGHRGRAARRRDDRDACGSTARERDDRTARPRCERPRRPTGCTCAPTWRGAAVRRRVRHRARLGRTVHTTIRRKDSHGRCRTRTDRAPPLPAARPRARAGAHRRRRRLDRRRDGPPGRDRPPHPADQRRPPRSPASR